ncbi:MAG TPA: enoyl-CoA hydratase/isomerase family protein [Gemmatimonadales bacterium]|nr:enoyl-CoA hydratase/isomerase family protein [Gemmatimonadales bacterium]
MLLTSLESGVLRLTLNRPEKRNALDRATIAALTAALARAELDAEVRVVAIGGAGKDFCAGADLDELLASADQSAEENEQAAARLGAVFTAIRRSARPVVALVHGRALAGGAGIATACDIVLAAESAQFGYPEIQRGFVPAMVMTILRRIVGEKQAFDLVATGRLLTAAEALGLGLVSRVVPDAAFAAESAALLARLAASSTSALALIKRLFYSLDGRSFEEGIALGAQVNALARAHPDFRAAVAAFLKK